MDRIQLRRDTSERWNTINPIPLEGELCFETDTRLRKIGDGTHNYNDLEYLAAENVVQELGDSETATISQNAITEAFKNVFDIPFKHYTINEATFIPVSDIVPSGKVSENTVFCIKIDKQTDISAYHPGGTITRSTYSSGKNYLQYDKEVESLRVGTFEGTLNIDVSILPNQKIIDSFESEEEEGILGQKTAKSIKFLDGQYVYSKTLYEGTTIRLPNEIRAGTLFTIKTNKSFTLQYYNKDDFNNVVYKRYNIPAGSHTIKAICDIQYLRFTAFGNNINISVSTYFADTELLKNQYGIYEVLPEAGNVPISSLGLSKGDHVGITISTSASIFLMQEDMDRIQIVRRGDIGYYEVEITGDNPVLRFTEMSETLLVHINKVTGLRLVDNLQGGLGALSAEQGRVLAVQPHTYAGYTNTYLDSFGKYIKSYRLSQSLSTPYLVRKLSSKDALNNSAGKTFYYDGYIYVLKYSNHLEVGNGESEYLNLAKVSVTNPSDITNIIAFDVDEVLRFSNNTSIKIIKAHEGALFINNNTIKVATLIEFINSDGLLDFQLCSKTFDLALSQVGNTNKCTFGIKGNSYNFSYRDIPNSISEWDVNWVDSVFNAGVTYVNGYYYGFFDFGSTYPGGLGVALVRSADYINWEYILSLPIEWNSYGETAITFSTEKDAFIIATRVWSGTIMCVMDKSFSKLSEVTYFKASLSGSMPSFFKVSNNLYVLIDGTNADMESTARNYYNIIKVNNDDLRSSEFICDTHGYRFGPNTILSVDNNHNIYGCLIGVEMKLCKFNIPEASQEECDEILSKLLLL